MFFGPLEAAKKIVSGSKLREPYEKPDGGNFFNKPGKTISGKKFGKMKELSGKNATLIVNVASTDCLTSLEYMTLQ